MTGRKFQKNEVWMVGTAIDISKFIPTLVVSTKKKPALSQVTTTTCQQFKVLNSSVHIKSIKKNYY